MARTKDMGVSSRKVFVSGRGQRIGRGRSRLREVAPQIQMSSRRKPGPITTGRSYCAELRAPAWQTNERLWLWVPDRARWVARLAGTTVLFPHACRKARRRPVKVLKA